MSRLNMARLLLNFLLVSAIEHQKISTMSSPFETNTSPPMRSPRNANVTSNMNNTERCPEATTDMNPEPATDPCNITNNAEGSGSGDGSGLMPEPESSVEVTMTPTTQAITTTRSIFSQSTLSSTTIATSSMETLMTRTADDISTTAEEKSPSTEPKVNQDTTGLVAAVATTCVVLVILIVILCGLICCYHMFR